MTNPEIGQSVDAAGIRTNYLDSGRGDPIMLLHGSGPGVSAYANWRLAIPELSRCHRVIALDFAGFGHSDAPSDGVYGREMWLAQAVALLDSLGLDEVAVVGNSFGGSMALALAIRYPERVSKVILMGSMGVAFPLTDGLDAVWGYEPSEEAMGRLMREVFSYDASAITDDMVAGRYTSSLRRQAEFSSMFPAPRQRWVESMAFDDDEIRGVTAPTLVLHGRDDAVIPLSNSLTLLSLIDDATLHVFGHCGHWTQIEHADAFAREVLDFVDGAR